MRRLFIALGVAFIALAGFAVALHAVEGADAVVGTWFSEGNKSKIEIYKVGDKYFGKIVWLKNPNDDSGSPDLDDKNPDPAKRSQPVLGLVIMRNFEYQGNSKWGNGKIYDPESGNTYSSYMILDGNNTLKLRGYIGLAAIGRTSTWTRAQ